MAIYTGQVRRIYPTTHATFIRIDLPPGTPEPASNYFRLLLGHPNYNALYSLALVAAVNRYHLRIKIDGEIDPAVTPDVVYMRVHW